MTTHTSLSDCPRRVRSGEKGDCLKQIRILGIASPSWRACSPSMALSPTLFTLTRHYN